MALIAGLISGGLTFVRADYASIPLAQPGANSVFTSLIESTVFWGFVISALSFRHTLRVTQNRKLLNGISSWLIRGSVAFAIMIVWVCLAINLGLALVHFFNPNVILNNLSATIISFIYVSLLSYSVAQMSSRLTTRGLLIIGIFVFILGLVIATIFSSDIRWLTEAISFLGADQGAIAFNLAFILCGFLVVAVVADTMDDLRTLRNRGVFVAIRLDILRSILLAGGFTLSGIGLFTYKGDTLLLHNICAHAALICFFLSMVLLPNWVPVLGSTFTVLSYICSAIFLVLLLSYMINILAFSLMELIMLAVCIIWLVSFQISSSNFIRQHDPTLLVSIGGSTV